MPHIRFGTTHDLRIGDIVHTHGMLVELDRKPTIVDGPLDRTCYTYRGLVLNLDDLADTWLTRFVRSDSRDTDRGQTRWSIQGNELAYWSYERRLGSSYRLTDNDETTARRVMAEVVAGWTSFVPAPGGSQAFESLVRVGAHAIGCATHDLRHCELEWLTQQAHALLTAIPVD